MNILIPNFNFIFVLQFCIYKRTEIQVAMLLHRIRFFPSLHFLNGSFVCTYSPVVIPSDDGTDEYKSFHPCYVTEKLMIETHLCIIFNTIQQLRIHYSKFCLE